MNFLARRECRFLAEMLSAETRRFVHVQEIELYVRLFTALMSPLDHVALQHMEACLCNTQTQSPALTPRHQSSMPMAAFDSQYMTSYWFSLVT